VSRRDRDDRDRVAGVSDRNRDRRCRRDRDDRVAGEQDFCRRVRRCLENDRVAGAEDRNRNRNRCNNRGFWF
jgi:hypothetical protein